MDTRTGEIFGMDFVEELKKKKPFEAKFFKEIPDKYVDLLQGMNRAERRKWYREHKKNFNQPSPKPEATMEDKTDRITSYTSNLRGMSTGEGKIEFRRQRGECLMCGKLIQKNNPNQVKFWCCKAHRKFWRKGIVL